MTIQDLINKNFKQGDTITSKELELLEYEEDIDMIRVEQVQGRGEFADIHFNNSFITLVIEEA